MINITHLFFALVSLYIYIYMFVGLLFLTSPPLSLSLCLYKVKICSPDGDADYFDIVAGVLQGDTLGHYLFIICLDKVRMTLRKQKRKRRKEDTHNKHLMTRSTRIA